MQRIVVHAHRLTRAADFEGRIEGEGGIRIEHDAFAAVGAKARRLHFQVIAANRQNRQSEMCIRDRFDSSHNDVVVASPTLASGQVTLSLSANTAFLLEF